MEKIVELVRNWLFAFAGADKEIVELREMVFRYQSELSKVCDVSNHKTAIIVRYQDKCAFMQERINRLEDEIIRRDRVCADIEESIDNTIRHADALDEKLDEPDKRLVKFKRVLH